jgi:hypothetical protein
VFPGAVLAPLTSGETPFPAVASISIIWKGDIDYTSTIQAALDYASTKVAFVNADKSMSVKVYLSPGLYRCSSLTIPEAVALIGNGALLKTNAAASNFITLNSRSELRNITLSGWGASLVSENAVKINSGTSHAMVANVNIDGFGGSGVIDYSLASVINYVAAINCVYGADALADYVGVFQLNGADTWSNGCEGSARGALGLSASGKAAAMVVNGANQMINDFIGETSDIGIVLTAAALQTKMDGVRGELCYGYGWLILGGNGRISNPSALRNSRQTDLGFDEFHVTGEGQFVVSNLICTSSSSGNKANWGVFDNNFNKTIAMTYIAPICTNISNQYFTVTNSGARFMFAPLPYDAVTYGISAGNLSVDGIVRVKLGSASPTNLTAFTKGVNGQQVDLLGDGNTTFVNSGSLVTKTGANTLAENGAHYTYVKIAGIWKEI